MQLTAGKAFLRPAQNCCRSASLVDARMVVAPSSPRDILHDADEMIDFRLGPVEFDDDQRLRVERIAAGLKALDRMDRRSVHHLQPSRDDAARDDRADATRSCRHARKAEQQPARDWRPLQQPYRHLRDDAEQSFGARHQAYKVISLAVQMLAAEPDQVAAHQHDVESQYIVGRQSVFQTVNAAGVLGDIAADRTGDLRGWIRRVVEALRLDGFGDRQVLDARLHARAAVLIVDVEDSIEFGHAEKNAVFKRHRTAGQRRAGAARHDLDIHLGGERHDGANLLNALGQRDDQRQRAIHRESVAFIGATRDLVDDQAFTRQNGAKSRDQFVASRHDLRLGRRHEESHRPAPPMRARAPLNAADFR